MVLQLRFPEHQRKYSKFSPQFPFTQTSVTLLSPTTSDYGWLPRFPKKLFPELLQDVDLRTGNHLWFIHIGAPHTFSSCSSRILEQPVSETMDSTKWTNRTACFFPWLKALSSFISVEICSLFLCYSSQWRPGLAKTNTEWIQDDPYHLEIFSESGSHCSEVRCLVLRSTWALRAFSVISKRS